MNIHAKIKEEDIDRKGKKRMRWTMLEIRESVHAITLKIKMSWNRQTTRHVMHCLLLDRFLGYPIYGTVPIPYSS